MRSLWDYKWTVLILAVLVMCLQQATRQTYGAVLPQIKSDFSSLGVSDVGLGLVGSVMSAVYAFAAVGMSFAADRFGRKKVIVIGLVFLSAGMFVSGLATSLLALAVGYGVLNAIGQSSLGPAVSSLVSQYHGETRATALSVFQAAVYLGIVAGAVGSGWLGGMGPGKWRHAFTLFAALCVVGACVSGRWLRDLPVAASVGKPKFREAAAALLGKPSAVFQTLAFAMFMFAGIGYAIWAPTFLQVEFAASPTQAGLHATLWHMLGSFVGVAIGGRCSDRFGALRPGARSEIAVAGLLLSIPFVLLAASARSLALCCTALAVWGVFRGLYDANVYATFYSVVVPRYWASAAGLFASFAFLASTFAPVLLAWIGQVSSLRVAFASLSLFYLLAAILMAYQRVRHFERDLVREQESK